MNQAQKMKNLINNTFELAKTIDGVKTVYISGDFTSHYVKKMFGDVYCYYDNTNDLKQDWTFYNSIHGDDVIRLFEGLKSEYNPIENYDRYEDSGISHTGTIGNSGNSTSTSKTSAYDSDTLVTDGEITGNTGNTTTFNNDDTTTSHIHGNIGVVDAPSMLSNESRIRFNNFIEHYLNKWLTSIIVGYGSEDNEIEFSQDTEYATKTELETLAQSTSDALNSLTNTVNSHGASITTLDNSLGATISDVREVENDVQILDGVVNNIGSDVSNHETRIEALESSTGGVSEEDITVTLSNGFTFFNNRYFAHRIGKICYLSAVIVNSTQMNVSTEIQIGTVNYKSKTIIFGSSNVNNLINDVYIDTMGKIVIIPRVSNIPSNSRTVINLMWEIKEPS